MMVSLELNKAALAAGFAISAGLLAGAHLFEAAGYAPCELCLDQREAHWTAIALAAAGLMAAFAFKADLAAAAGAGALALVYALSAGLALYHTGVENGYWPGPATCSTLGDAVNDISALTTAFAPEAKGPACSEAPWRLLGVSMAGYNFLISAGLFAFTLAAALDANRIARARRRPSGAMSATGSATG